MLDIADEEEAQQVCKQGTILCRTLHIIPGLVCRIIDQVNIDPAWSNHPVAGAHIATFLVRC